jgi:hypothetical protein
MKVVLMDFVRTMELGILRMTRIVIVGLVMERQEDVNGSSHKSPYRTSF